MKYIFTILYISAVIGKVVHHQTFSYQGSFVLASNGYAVNQSGGQ